MNFSVKVSLFDSTVPDLEDIFGDIIVNEDSGLLLLFKELDSDFGKAQKIVRYAIPLNSIESFSVEPIYEDNEQKIPRC